MKKKQSTRRKNLYSVILTVICTFALAFLINPVKIKADTAPLPSSIPEPGNVFNLDPDTIPGNNWSNITPIPSSTPQPTSGWTGYEMIWYLDGQRNHGKDLFANTVCEEDVTRYGDSRDSVSSLPPGTPYNITITLDEGYSIKFVDGELSGVIPNGVKHIDVYVEKDPDLNRLIIQPWNNGGTNPLWKCTRFANYELLIDGVACEFPDNGKISWLKEGSSYEIRVTPKNGYIFNGFIDGSAKGTITRGTTKLTASFKYSPDTSNNNEPEKEKIILDEDMISLEYDTTEYNRKHHYPKVTIDGLEENTDFTVKYTDNVTVGTAQAIVTGKGNVEGTVSKIFYITPQTPSIRTMSSTTNTITVKFKKMIAQAKQADGFEVVVSPSKNFSNSSTTIVNGGGNTSTILYGLSKGTRYYVKMRAFKNTVNGPLYSGWSATVSKKTATRSRYAHIVLEFTDGSRALCNLRAATLTLGDKKLAYVYMGSYPQTEMKGTALTSAIKNAKYDKNGYATVNGVKYKRITQDDALYVRDKSYDEDLDWIDTFYYDWTGKKYAYFKCEPIKWRVLRTANGKALLLSEYCIDFAHYEDNEEVEAVTWAGCSLRTWLNNDFLTSAFSASERTLIPTVTLSNSDNPVYGTPGGAVTRDKIYLLSYSGLKNPKYGFESDSDELDRNRLASATDYTKAKGLSWTWGDCEFPDSDYETLEGNYISYWWLRTPGARPDYVTSQTDSSYVSEHGTYAGSKLGVRPVMQLKLSKIFK